MMSNKKQNQSLVLIRGIPGSGKTTLAKNIIAGLRCGASIAHIEADQYFTSPNGEYKYDPSKIGDAHAWCQDCTRYYLEKDCNVIVANTFIKLWELWPYMRMAAETNTAVKIIEAKGRFQNIHRVPDDVIQRMITAYEPLPWNI